MGPQLLLIIALAGSPPPKKLEVPKVDAPKLDLTMPNLPKADGLNRTESEKGPELKHAPGSLTTAEAGTAKIEKATHAKDFAQTLDGKRAKNAIEAIRVPKFPAKVDPFKTCLRISSKDGSPAGVTAKLLTPRGEELLSTRGDVVFGSSNQVDFVIDWDAFDANAAGDYKVVVTLDGKQAGEYPIKISAP